MISHDDSSKGATGNPAVPRLLFLIKSAKVNEIRRTEQQASWLRHLPSGSEYYFCIGCGVGGAPRLEDRCLFLPVPDGYDHLPAKMKAMVAWAAKRPEFDYVVTMDDDVVVEMDRLLTFLKHEPDHFGNRWDGDPSHISGMLVGYSRTALEILCQIVHDLPDTGVDDLLLSRLVRMPLSGLKVMTEEGRFVPYGQPTDERTIAVEIRPFRAGAMRAFRFDLPRNRNRVSFCLYGDDPKYVEGAIANAKLVPEYYPGWEAVFHTRNVKQEVLVKLRSLGATVVECQYANMMFARFLPFCDTGVVLSRDCDSRIGPREVRAVNEWLESDKPAHVIRDHPEHLPGWALIPGGLWGSRLPFGDGLKQALMDALNDPHYGGWGGDQRWLAEKVWRRDGFHIHQYDQVEWMRESWKPDDFCGMIVPAPAPPAKEVVLFEGFFNRLNGLVNARLTHGPRFRVRWALNSHFPHRFEDIFEPTDEIEINHEPGLGYCQENTNPGNGPLCYWYVSRHCGANFSQVEEAYQYFISKLKVPNADPPSPLGIHYRGLHHGSHVSPTEFAKWCLDQARGRNINSCFAIADRGRNEIQSVLEKGGIEVIWGTSPPLGFDLDRANLTQQLAFIGDGVMLANCETVLTSFDESTITDPARAFGREVIAYSGSRGWTECWFHHRGGNTNPLANDDQDPGPINHPVVPGVENLNCVYDCIQDTLSGLGLRDTASRRYDSDLEVIHVVLAALQPKVGDILLEIASSPIITAMLLATGAQVYAAETVNFVVSEGSCGNWLANLRESNLANSQWRKLNAQGAPSLHDPPAGCLFGFIECGTPAPDEMVNQMMAGGISVIVAGFFEPGRDDFDHIASASTYSIHDHQASDGWTRVWSAHCNVTALLDNSPNFQVVGSSPALIDLRTIPVCLIGGENNVAANRQHRYSTDRNFADELFQHTEAVPPMPGGHAFGCSAAHLNATVNAIENHHGSPVLLLENDAVQSAWFTPILDGLPSDADIIWVGHSREIYEGRQSPEVILNANSPYQRLRGICQASHAVLLVTESGKLAWRTACERTLAGELNGITDLAGSLIGITLCRQYVIDRPLFFQPAYDSTNRPIREWEIEAQQAHWKDTLVLKPDGTFKRRSTQCHGNWWCVQNGVIRLEWVHWGTEYLVPNETPPTGEASIGERVRYICKSTPSRSITIELSGGLGNQMFQYAHALAVAKHFQIRLKVAFAKHSRPFALGIFGISVDCELAESTHLVEDCGSYQPGKPWPSIEAIARSNAQDFRLSGYFQNEEYFRTVQGEIRNRFQIEGIRTSACGDRTAVGVHVRRGDFIGSHLHDICSLRYYLQAMEVIRAQVENPLFVVVSDDPIWCVEHFPNEPDFVICPNLSERDAMATLCGCDAFILSNSTFGWWAAWLSDGQIVVAPNRFLKDREWIICPERWQTLDPNGIQPESPPSSEHGHPVNQ